MNWSRAGALALGAMKATDIVKEVVLPYGVLPEWAKSGMATTIAGVGAAMLDDGEVHERVLTGMAAAGLAAMVHESYALVTSYSDRNKASFLRARARKGVAASGGPSAPGARVPTL